MKKRVYILEYDITFPNGQEEHRVIHFTKEDRHEFITQYIHSVESYYISNIHVYIGEVDELDKDQMQKLIDSY